MCQRYAAFSRGIASPRQIGMMALTFMTNTIEDFDDDWQMIVELTIESEQKRRRSSVGGY